MKAENAARLSDAVARKRHPRSDFRTDEARVYTNRLRPFFEQVIFPGCKALDLGCSSGKFTFAMEQHGARAVGLDCSGEAIAFAKEIAQDIHNHLLDSGLCQSCVIQILPAASRGEGR